MRVIVVGATGNVGSSVVAGLAEQGEITSMLGIARREPDWTVPNTEWAELDIGKTGRAELVRRFRGADVVIHLAWMFQPTHNVVTTWRINVLGGIRVFDAVAAAGVPALVYASSVGAYSPGPKDEPVDEGWPTHGWPTAAYCREKAYLERYLDGFERANPEVRVVRLRPGVIFKRESASQQRRLFAGPLLPNRLVHPKLLPFVPDLPGLRFQALHTADVAAAYQLAAVQDVRGAFNLAAEPVVDGRMLAALFGARTVSLPSWPVRAALAGAWHLHLVPASPPLFDAVLRLPIMSTARARDELGWAPECSAADAIAEFVDGLRAGAGMGTPPLAPRVPGGRLAELRAGVGRRP